MSVSININLTKSTQDSRDLVLPHQQAAVDAMNVYFNLENNNAGAQTGLLVMPTGSGKTFTAVNWLIHNAIPKGYKVIWLAHRQELIDQTYNEFVKQVPHLSQYGLKSIKIIAVSGIHSSMSQASRFDINICSIQSIAHPNGLRFIKSMLGETGTRKLIVVIDEAHHSISASYQKVLRRITDINTDRILLGLTATPTRMSDKEKRKLFNMYNVPMNMRMQVGTKSGYIFEAKLIQLIRDGFLAKPIYIKVDTEIEGEIEYNYTLDDLFYFQKYQDFSESMKDEIAKSSSRNKVIVDEYVKNSEKYRKTLIFAVNQLHAETLMQEFRSAGVTCDCVRSDKPGTYATIQEFKNNKFDVLINVQILTEGSDVPSIQTVFLTRETNSDALLMQMIGRGLRGPVSGGTETAYIVDFHDKWDKFVMGLDPNELDIFRYAQETEENASADALNQQGLPELEERELVGEPFYNFNEAYLRLYACMKSNVIAKQGMSAIPCGWYSVVDQNGIDEIVLVYEQQLPNYEQLSAHSKEYIAKKYSAAQILNVVFYDQVVRPTAKELQEILDIVEYTGNMPDYFTFDDRLDLKDIVADMRKAGLLQDDLKSKDMATTWLKELYDVKPILRNVYKSFYLFRKSVELAAKRRVDATIEVFEDREQYDVVENYYNLEALLNEVISEYPFLNKDGLKGISWSNNVLKTWFGLCKKWVSETGVTEYHILINKILSTPQVSAEVVKYLIYHEMLHVLGYWSHDVDFREKEWAFKNSEELDGFLDQMAINYKIDFKSLKSQYNAKTRGEVQNTGGKLKESMQPQFQESGDDSINQSLQEANNQSKEIPIYETYSEEAQPLKVSPVIIMPEVKYCRDCGNALPKTAKYCDKCGVSTDY